MADEPLVGNRVRIEWHDSVIASDGWADPEELVAVTTENMPHLAAGYIAAQTDTAIVLCSAYQPATGRGAGCVAIPRRSILAMEAQLA